MVRAAPTRESCDWCALWDLWLNVDLAEGPLRIPAKQAAFSALWARRRIRRWLDPPDAQATSPAQPAQRANAANAHAPSGLRPVTVHLTPGDPARVATPSARCAQRTMRPGHDARPAHDARWPRRTLAPCRTTAVRRLASGPTVARTRAFAYPRDWPAACRCVCRRGMVRRRTMTGLPRRIPAKPSTRPASGSRDAKQVISCQ
jgi:hypothetical protein